MIKITFDKLNPELITNSIKNPNNGAVITFLGTTRNYTENRKVLHLEYEAYAPMAEKKLNEIIKYIQKKWDINDIYIAHRLGKVEIGEISLVVSISSPHRKSAFIACEYVIDTLKLTVPIWKKEFFQDESKWVNEPKF
ncbi:MAG: hypothetical protein CL766_04695 [Chloroflexi bacterium]|jgi:molybdopterin synthase catalytic subunit|nr:hypothetical protein [Chloroflexota bacterium]MCH2304216.1 molybdenum cofactor biosynthesis protein MoaE [SAR202 cluster bacterium]|tara:strand:- start:67209 stop:67622 length:414 start_codon:yes stop_codon:yes gene_type:complete